MHGLIVAAIVFGVLTAVATVISTIAGFLENEIDCFKFAFLSGIVSSLLWIIVALSSTVEAQSQQIYQLQHPNPPAAIVTKTEPEAATTH